MGVPGGQVYSQPSEMGETSASPLFGPLVYNQVDPSWWKQPPHRLASGAGALHLAPGKPHQGLCVQWDSTPEGAGAAGSPSPRPLTPIPYGHAMCERPWPVSLVWGRQKERGVSPSPASVPRCPWEQEVAVSAAPFPVGGGLRIGSHLHRAGWEMTEMNPRKAGVHVVAGGRFPKDPTGTTAP